MRKTHGTADSPRRPAARLLMAFLGLAVLPAGLSPVANAQDASPSMVHWAYSSYFGTGWYEIRDDRDVYVLRAMPRWSLREASLSADGERALGIEFRLAITAGVDSLTLADYQLDDEQLLISWHGLYTTLENDLNLDIVGGSRAAITDQWEFGLSLRKETSPIKITWFSFDRLGLAYRFSSSGDLKGINLVLSSAFDR